MASIKREMKPVFTRIENAIQNFIDNTVEQGFTADEAVKILNVYKKAKAVKLNVAMGRYDIKHGAFLDIDVMRRALEVEL